MIMAMLKKNDTLDATEFESSSLQEMDEGKKNTLFSLLKKTGRVVFQFILMAAILFGGYSVMNRLIAAQEEPAKRPPFKTVYTVDTVVAEAGNFQPEMIVYGEVQASKSVELRSLVAGKIVSVNPDVKAGGRVREGDVLFEIDRFDYETALGGAKSNAIETEARIAENQAVIAIEEARIKSLKEQLALAQSDLERIRQLRSRGSATPRAVEERELIVSQRAQALQQSELNLVVEKARTDQLKAVLARFERGIAEAERDLENTIFKAPMSGVILTNNASEGRLVSSNDMVISMYRDVQLDVRFTLTDQRFGRIQSDSTGVIGREVEVIWTVGGEEFRYPAIIERLGAQITSDRGGVEVISSIQSDIQNSPLRPGAFVEIIVPDKMFEGSYYIPETALYENQDIYVDVEGKLEKRKVKVLARDGDNIIVEGEIKDGDRILVTRISEISEGLNVRAPQPAQSN